MINSDQTVFVSLQLNVKDRLSQLRDWKAEWERADYYLEQRIAQLSDSVQDQQVAMQIAGLKKRMELTLIQRPLELSEELIIEAGGYQPLQDFLHAEFAALTTTERILWLNNFKMIMTPDLRELEKKIVDIRGYRMLGQQRNFLLGGESGMGKTTFLNWLIYRNLPRVEMERNHIPILAIDAPTDHKSPIPLYRWLISACGYSYLKGDTESELLGKVILFFLKCGVEIVMVDEIEHLTKHAIRRKLLEISNLTPGVTYICASCAPMNFVEGDVEIQGRWNDIFELELYKGERLDRLLSYLELLLPFSKPSDLVRRTLETSPDSDEVVDGPAQVIENLTGGILRDIMILIIDSSKRAIERNLPSLTVMVIQDAWRNIQSKDPRVKQDKQSFQKT